MNSKRPPPAEKAERCSSLERMNLPDPDPLNRSRIWLLLRRILANPLVASILVSAISDLIVQLALRLLT